MLILCASQDVSEVLRSSHSTGTVVEELKINLQEKSDIIIKGLNESSLVQKELLAKMHELKQTRDQLLDDHPAHEDFLDTLRFRHMDDREDAISEAHARTYRWLLSDFSSEPELGKETSYEAVRSKVRTHIIETFSQLGVNVNTQENPIGLNVHDRCPIGHLHDWLKSEDRIFWIWGKPGCGKSTLMKLMLRDWKMKKRLQKMLMEWSDSKPLLIASFFFFRPGMNMQKSQSGFLRSLLYQIFSQRRDAINNVFTATEQNKAIARASEANYDEDVWSDREMLRAFRKWRESDDVKLYLHVDGIDEIDATYAMITQMITDMAEHENVKILVAGRWSPEFQATFPHTLALHETTSLDILQFTVDNLRQPQVIEILDLPGEQFLSIVKELVEAAQGVFQWVKIVVQSLLHGAHRFERFSQLKARLLEYPRELDQLYWFLYNSIEAGHMSDAAYWLLTVYLRARESPNSHSASQLLYRQHAFLSKNYMIGFSFDITARRMALIDMFDLDNPTCLENMLRHRNSPGNTQDTQAKVIQRRMRSQCPHFFEFGPVQNGCTISLAHRTVLDFLTTSEIQDRLQKNLLSGKDPLFALIAVKYATKNIGLDLDHDIITFRNCLPIIEAIVQLTHKKPFSDVRGFWTQIAFVFQKHHTVDSEQVAVLYPTLSGWRREALTEFLRHIFTDSTDPAAYILAYWHPDSSYVGAYISQSLLGPQEKELLVIVRCINLEYHYYPDRPSFKHVHESLFKLLLPNGTPRMSIGLTLLCDVLDYYLRMANRDIDVVKADLQTALPLLHLFIDNGAGPNLMNLCSRLSQDQTQEFPELCEKLIAVAREEVNRDGQVWETLIKSLEDLIAKSDNCRL